MNSHILIARDDFNNSTYIYVLTGNFGQNDGDELLENARAAFSEWSKTNIGKEHIEYKKNNNEELTWDDLFRVDAVILNKYGIKSFYDAIGNFQKHHGCSTKFPEYIGDTLFVDYWDLRTDLVKN